MTTGSRRTTVLLSVASVLVVSCTSDSAGTSLVSETSTPAAPATTEPEDSITTTSRPASTTSRPSTTPSTTTTAGVTRTWADEPLVITGRWMGALGWWGGDEWVQVESDTVLPIDGGEDY
jgi:hypothetical protein